MTVTSGDRVKWKTRLFFIDEEYDYDYIYRS